MSTNDSYNNFVLKLSGEFYKYLNQLVVGSVSTACKEDGTTTVEQTKTIIDKTVGSVYDNCNQIMSQTIDIRPINFCPSVGPKMFEYLDGFIVYKNIPFTIDDKLRRTIENNLSDTPNKDKAIENIKNINQMYVIDKEETLKNIENKLSIEFLDKFKSNYPNEGFYKLLISKLNEYIYFMITFLKKMSYQKFNNDSEKSGDLDTLKDMDGVNVNFEYGNKSLCMQNINVKQDQNITVVGKILCKNSTIKFDQETIVNSILSCVENGPSLYNALKGDKLLKDQYLNPSSADVVPACSIERTPITPCINDKIKYRVRVLNDIDCSLSGVNNGSIIEGDCDNNCYVSDWGDWSVCRDGYQYRTRSYGVPEGSDSKNLTKYRVCPALVEKKSCNAPTEIQRKPEGVDQVITNPYMVGDWMKENKNILIAVFVMVCLFIFILF